MSGTDPLFDKFGRAYAAGDVIFREGEHGDKMYVVHAGRVRISKEVGGKDQTLAMLGPGDFFGEMAILNNKPRTASAEVVENSKLLIIDAKTFEAMVKGNAEIAVRLIQKLARRLDEADALIEILMRRDPKARVIMAVSRHVDGNGVPLPDGGTLIPMSVEELASEIGLTSAEAEPVLARLRRVGLVLLTKEGIVVRDALRLSEFLEFVESRSPGGEC